jgi:hypothetical protein
VRAVIDAAADVSGVVLRHAGGAEYVDDAMAALLSGAVQLAPNVSLSARLDNPPSAVGRVRDGFPNVLVGMFRHRPSFRVPSLDYRVQVW